MYSSMNNFIKQSIKHVVPTVKNGLFISSKTVNLRSLSSANSLINTKKFNDLKSNHIQDFAKILGENGIKSQDLDGYNTDWLKIHKGKSELCLLPSTVDQLSKTLRYCYDNDLSVCIQGKREIQQLLQQLLDLI